MSEQPYLLDQLESADMLEIDGLHAFDFQLDDALLDQADVAAEADESFASEATVLHIEAQDGRERKRWQFSYNAVMEAEYQSADDSWTLGEHRLRCFDATAADSEDD
ncbi:DUF5629 family protein [Pseudomonas seleniipraecipitans]|uniref:DUF5629 family protein n=1 Tax=Phytopseudomonas seleniipraecipitans TaxID=640205 RepID=A0A1G7QRD3_9GAMM|nr:DUF5629 family protein [Pseudomonas seleniipraecipitans]UUD64227.1 DUF5629 family protein [Pseudomonas seleniipraecipitans]SDG01078.1 hypothetical protein SAMN05216381_2922 [Pseudomonas seleniipraecipitans]